MPKQECDKSKAVMLYLSKHPNVGEWGKVYPKEAQMFLCNNEINLGAVNELAVDECPTLGLFYNCYQHGAVLWMLDQLSVINTMANVSNRLNDAQMSVLATDILVGNKDLNLADVCIFLGRLRRGMYGTFYNSVDNIKIMEALNTYREDRRVDIDWYERQKKITEHETRKEEWTRNAVTFEEYSKIRERAVNGDEDAIKALRWDSSRKYGGADMFVKHDEITKKV